MEKKIYKVAILGVGARGAEAYGKNIFSLKDKFEIVALCDKRIDRLQRWGKEFHVKEENLFLDEDEFFKEKRADLLVIATQDADHVGHALKAFKTGYDILVEKPLTDKREECEQLLAAQKEYGGKALVCHVLRYAPAFVKTAELIDSGAIGQLVAIDALERVCYWHQAHSYVRGNWRTSTVAAPMILAKCCHDLDLIQYYAKSKCATISSVGDLVHFKKACAPDGSAERCIDCKYINSCPYSAKHIYVDRWKNANPRPLDRLPFSVLTNPPLTEEKLLEAIKTGPYGRCVYRCDNDVVDHQLATMAFENGVKATLTMTGFTSKGGRRMTFFGTKGDLVLEEETNTITVTAFGKKPEIIDVSTLISNDNGYSHGGGDRLLIEALYDVLEGKATSATSLESSIESHLMGICAEESRLQGGKLVSVH